MGQSDAVRHPVALADSEPLPLEPIEQAGDLGGGERPPAHDVPLEHLPVLIAEAEVEQPLVLVEEPDDRRFDLGRRGGGGAPGSRAGAAGGANDGVDRALAITKLIKRRR